MNFVIYLSWVFGGELKRLMLNINCNNSRQFINIIFKVLLISFSQLKYKYCVKMNWKRLNKINYSIYFVNFTSHHWVRMRNYFHQLFLLFLLIFFLVCWRWDFYFSWKFFSTPQKSQKEIEKVSRKIWINYIPQMNFFPIFLSCHICFLWKNFSLDFQKHDKT